ncbi:MAG: SDR family oxidoreductase [Bacteroidetes bacterium]|nr:SDR family oxidoreductase [Bacteroidota bacterium]
MNIIITGAGQGIGLELAKAFTEDPGNVIIALSRKIDKLQTLAEQKNKGKLIFSELIPFSFDLVKGDYRELSAFAGLYFNQADILINNAGLLVNKPFQDILPEEFDAVFDTNVKAVFRMVQTFLPAFHKGSHIVNISSMGAVQGSRKFPGLSVYSASKGAVTTLTECLAEELKGKGIIVNGLALGSVQTEMLTLAFPGLKAPITAASMASYIKDFAVSGRNYYNGKVLNVALTTP